MAKAKSTTEKTAKPASTAKPKKAAPAKVEAPKKAPAKPAVKKATAKAEAVPAKKAATATKKATTKAKAPAAAKSKTKGTAAVKKTAAPAKAPRKAPARKKASPAAENVAENLAISDPAVQQRLRAIEADTRQLPTDYGDTKIVLMPRDPEKMFVYWEISRDVRRRHGIEKHRHNRPLILRVLEKFDSADGFENRYDVEVTDQASQHYLPIKERVASLRVTLGIYGTGGAFQKLASSAEVSVPRIGIAEETDVQFATINDEVYGQIVELSGGSKFTGRTAEKGGDDFLRNLQQRVISTITDGPFSSGGLAGGLSSGSLYGLSSGLFAGASSFLLPSSFQTVMGIGEGGEDSLKTARVDQRDFWLEVGVDVIVYGATQPNAKLTLMGQRIALSPDGRFRIRMVLPDTEIEFPVEAESADGRERRRVKPVVRRSTEGNPHEPA